jgi:hypothetical protein
VEEILRPSIFHNDLYNHDYYFFVENTKEQYETFIRKTDPSYSANFVGAYGYCTNIGNKTFIWLKTRRALGALVHECIHAASYTLIDRGIKIDPRNDEPLAYLSQWVFRKCYDRLKRLKK